MLFNIAQHLCEFYKFTFIYNFTILKNKNIFIIYLHTAYIGTHDELIKKFTPF